MTWQMTIHVVDCSSMSTDLAGAEISKGAEVLGNTDASGQLDVVLLDTETFVVLRAKKICPPPNDKNADGSDRNQYLSGSEMYTKDADDGATRTMCLTPNPYGCDDETTPGQEGQPLTQDGPCFIVTAATGSAQSEAVVQMRALRDRVKGVSMLGGQLIDSIYSEYEQFSPRIAAEIDRDVLSREVVLQAVVRPLLAWYRLAGIVAFGDTGRQSAAQELRDACPRELVGLMLPVLDALRGGGDWPSHTPEYVLQLAPELAGFQFVPWAIVDPLVRVWRSSRDGLDLVNEVAQWMATAPVDLLTSATAPPLSSELQVLSGFFDFDRSAQRQFGGRLLMVWPDSEGLLESAGFSRPTPAKHI